VAHREQGLRHGDYGRYRHYCTRRLRRLFKKSVHFCHKDAQKKHKFQRKEIDRTLMEDPSREILIPLVQSERCWALANELKDDQAMKGAMNAAKRAHAKKRMKKACEHAKEFKDLCAYFGDAKLRLESEAYCAFMNAVADMNDFSSSLTEAKKSAKKENATKEFTKVKKIYECLSKVGPTEHKMSCEERAREMNPLILTSSREIKDESSFKKELQEIEKEIENSANMKEAIERLKLNDPLLTGEDAILATHIQWRNTQFRIFGEFGMRSFGSVQKILNRLKNEASSLSVDKTLTLYKKLFAHIEETKKHLSKACRDAESMMLGSEYNEDELAQLRLTTQALDVLVLEKEISRDAFLAERLEGKLYGKTPKHKSDRNLKFEHLVRVYDALIASNYILTDAAMEIIRGADADAIIESLEADIFEDIEKQKKSRDEAFQRALTEPNDPIASKVKALKVSDDNINNNNKKRESVPRVVMEGKNIAEFVYNRAEASVQFEQARAEHAKKTGVPTPVLSSSLPSPRAAKANKPTGTKKSKDSDSDSEGFHSADDDDDDNESDDDNSEFSGSSDYESDDDDYEDAGPGYLSSAAGALGRMFSRG
jgi:hypothetical protein